LRVCLPWQLESRYQGAGFDGFAGFLQRVSIWLSYCLYPLSRVRYRRKTCETRYPLCFQQLDFPEKPVQNLRETRYPFCFQSLGFREKPAENPRYA
jgi:hypothetical protein